MKVRIDYDFCMGDRDCHTVCPEVFDYDDDQLIGIVREKNSFGCTRRKRKEGC